MHKQYLSRVSHSYKHPAQDFELHKGLAVERHKTMELLVAIRDAVIEFKNISPSFHLLREHELLNQDLGDLLEQYRHGNK
jgi:hypothetical protein